MNLYRHKEDRKLYTIAHLIISPFLNRNAFAGIYAYPYDWNGETITHTKQECWDKGIPYDPHGFVQVNFEVVAELFHV